MYIVVNNVRITTYFIVLYEPVEFLSRFVLEYNFNALPNDISQTHNVIILFFHTTFENKCAAVILYISFKVEMV